MKTLFVFALVMSVWSCSGLPVYDYEPSIAEEALRASIGRVNSRSQWPALFGVVRSYVRGVDLLDNNDYSIVLDFIVRETTCTKDSEKDPSLCDFRVGRYVQTAFCRSTARVSEEKIQNLAVYCSQDGSSSESSSSEEMMFMEMMAPNRRGDSRNEAVQCEPQSVDPGAETRCCSYRLYWWECQRDKQEWKQHYRCVTQ